MIKLLKELTQITAPSGNEEQIKDFIQNEIKDYVDDIETDALGNIIAHKKGSGEKVMFAAHTDEIGVIVTYIEDNGLLRFSALGGISAHFSLFKRIRFINGICGVVAYENKDDDTLKKLKISDLFIDIGAKNKEEAEKMVSVGLAGGFVGPFLECGNNLTSKSMDNRAGCAVLIEAIKSIKTHSNDLYFVFTASEELGLRGAKVAANRISPDYAVAIDVTRTGDIPGKIKMPIKLGGGVAIKVKDSSILSHPYIKNLMVDVCEKNDIKYQLEVLESGGTDSGAIHLSGGGVATGCISIPTRYIHTVSETVNLFDLSCAVALTTKMIENGFSMK